MIRRKYLTHDQISKLVRVGLAVASFIIYFATTYVLREHQYSDYHAERYSLAAAVSSLVYGAPIGTVYSGIAKTIVDLGTPVQQNFELAARGLVEIGTLLTIVPDGNGIGFPVLTTIAMHFFGVQIWSLTLLLMALMGVSTLLFVLRYRDDRLFFIPLYFFSLTLICFTPFTTDQGILNEAPIGGIRYFTLLAIIPAMHLLLEIADPSRGDVKAASGNVVLLGLQSLILVATMVVRGSAGYLVGAIAVAFLLIAKANWRDSSRVRFALNKGILVAVLGAAFIGVFYLWVPRAYIDTGRTMGIVWHRVLISLGANPAWPFGHLSEDFSECKRFVPEGLVPGSYDRNGHCIWSVYTIRNGMRAQRAVDEIYDGHYEQVMRSTFFMIARKYPAEVLKAFLYYKPKLILLSLEYLARPDLPGKTARTKLLLLVSLFTQLAVLTLSAIISASIALENRLDTLSQGFLIFSIFNFAPYFVAWSNGHTSVELLFYLFSGFGLLLAAVIRRVHVYTSSCKHPRS